VDPPGLAATTRLPPVGPSWLGDHLHPHDAAAVRSHRAVQVVVSTKKSPDNDTDGVPEAVSPLLLTVKSITGLAVLTWTVP
jgi:hypothetical protein